ncbi:hypothetical protein VFPFJ_03610 [Purpureocillium lilacinum]|uniref:Uncharacterized protein n=1 Tax=Purpureocillium lilacinum TaxID=33203 RepID=A0A179HR14_PURLI|nr:hypothetical protein VFPFJ_03610 [Purpureocillium lilacinum]OAQ91870.1 hypothetical protein VFPFJ_03610 [Purpureocillium lilacinum]
MRAMRVMLECAPSLRQSSSRLCEQRGRRRLIDPIQARNRSKRGRDLSRHGGGRWGPGLPGRREKANKRSLAWINSPRGMAPDDSPNRKIPSPSTSLARLSLAAQFTLRDPLDQGLLVDSGLSSTRLRRRLGPSHNATPVNKAAVYAWI